MTKIIDKIVVSSTAPKEKNVLWVDDDSINIPSKGKWKKASGGGSGGSGIEIVDSIDRLDPNAELGSMASVVTAGSIQETSFRNLYQADASILDPNTYTLNTENCSLVGSLSITPPSAPIESLSTIILAFSTANMSLMSPIAGDIMVQLQFVPNADNTKLIGLGGMVMDVATLNQTNYTLFSINDDGSVTVNQDQIDALNDVFADNELYYLGTFMYAIEGTSAPSDFYDVVDTSIKAVAGIPSITDIYIKEDIWVQLYKSDLNNLSNQIDIVKNSINTKANIIPVISKNIISGTIEPNTYYRITCSAYSYLEYRLKKSIDASVYSEYIIELNCQGTPSSVKFQDSDGNDLSIKWPNGIEPIFVEGCTYIISIVDNFGVFTQYINS